MAPRPIVPQTAAQQRAREQAQARRERMEARATKARLQREAQARAEQERLLKAQQERKRQADAQRKAALERRQRQQQKQQEAEETQAEAARRRQAEAEQDEVNRGRTRKGTPAPGTEPIDPYNPPPSMRDPYREPGDVPRAKAKPYTHEDMVDWSTGGFGGLNPTERPEDFAPSAAETSYWAAYRAAIDSGRFKRLTHWPTQDKPGDRGGRSRYHWELINYYRQRAIEAAWRDYDVTYNAIPLGYEEVPGAFEEITEGPNAGQYIAMVKAQDPAEKARLEYIEDPNFRVLDPRIAAREAELAAELGYVTGAEGYLTPADAYEELLGMSDEELAATKLQMIALVPGYDESAAGSLHSRVINSETVDAFLIMVGDAQRLDMRWKPYAQAKIAEGVNANPGSGGRGSGGGGGAVDQIRLTNPDDLRAIANQVAQQRLGRWLSEAELDQFVLSFQAQETAFQSAYYAEQTPITEAPQADTAASTWIDQTRREDADVYAVGTALDTFLQMIGG